MCHFNATTPASLFWYSFSFYCIGFAIVSFKSQLKAETKEFCLWLSNGEQRQQRPGSLHTLECSVCIFGVALHVVGMCLLYGVSLTFVDHILMFVVKSQAEIVNLTLTLIVNNPKL